ncbi:hypothetical protein JL49_15120 [Pseudoalteromonas luteoviolacea]|nr:hypothetical protein JL49_15120 [Pseudoalteromonas luteoviolacea]
MAGEPVNFDFKKRLWMSVCAALVVFTLLLVTHTGNRVLMGLINYLVPQMNVEVQEGKLLSGGLVSINFQSSSVNIAANKARIDLTWFDCATVCLSVKVDNLRVNSSLTEAGSEMEPVSGDEIYEHAQEQISLPISFAIASLQVTSFQLEAGDHFIEFSDLNVSAEVHDSLLQVTHFQSEAIHIEQLRLPKEQASQVPDNLAPVITPDLYIPIDIDLPALQISNIDYQPFEQAPMSVADFELALSVESQTVHVESLAFSYLQNSAYAVMDYDLRSNLIHASVGVAQTKGALSAVIQGDLESLSIKSKVSGNLQARALLSISPATQNWPFSLDAQIGRADIAQIAKLSQIKLTGQGNANDYTFSIRGVADLSHAYGQMQPAHIQAAMNGTLSSLEVKNSRIQVDKAFTDLSAKIDWQDELSLNINGNLENLPIPNMGFGSTQSVNNAPLGALSGNYAVQFDQLRSTWKVNVEQFKLHGEIAEQPLSLMVRGEVNEQLRGHLEQAQLEYGASSIHISGELGKELDLTAKLDINQRATPVLPIDITLLGDLDITGLASAPKVVANTAISTFKYNDIALTDAQFSSDIDLAKDFAGNVSMMIVEANFPGVEKGKVTFNAKGSLASHTVALKLESELVSADMAVTGQLESAKWTAHVNKTDVDMASLKLELNNPIEVLVSDTNLSISEHCWRVSTGQACLWAQRHNKQGEAKVNLIDIPLDTASAWFPDGVSAEGKLTGQSELQWADNRLSALVGKISLLNGKVALTKSKADAENLPEALSTALTIKSFNIDLNGNADTANVDWQVQLDKLGGFNGSLHFPDIANTNTVNGFIDIGAIQLEEFTPYFRVLAWPDLTLAGQLNGRIELAGNITHPNVLGQFKVAQVSVLSSYLPMQVTELDLDLDVKDDLVTLSGKLRTPESGVADIHGTASLYPDLAVELKLKGQRLFMTPMAGAQVALSPDLHVQFSQQQLNIIGEVNVPFARFTLSALPEEAILVSEDQMIIGTQEPPQKSALMDFQADIDINLLDDVRVVALGLDAYLNGGLSLEKQLDTAILAAGEVSLRDGKYTAFGQDLFIETGQLGFNGPLDKPYLNIRAIRNPDTTANGVIAGVAVQGSIAEPELIIFSEPVMDQAKALAYLLNGEALGAGESSNNTMLAQFLLSKSIDKSKGLFTKAGKKLGLKDVNLAAKGSGDDTQVELSGYITPSVQVSYRVGVFASLSEIAVRYRIFSKLYIEATSGLYDSIDLLYKFDWGD